MIFRTAGRLTPLRNLTAHRSLTAHPPIPIHQLQRIRPRFSSSQAESPNARFYKTFGRPIAKVFLLAVLTYQLAYYAWVRLEHDEIRSSMRATIADLEARIEQLEKARKK